MANPNKEKPDIVMDDAKDEPLENGQNANDFAEVETSHLIAEMEEKKRLLNEALDRYKRLQADFDNFRRRTAKEKEDIAVIVTERIISELLPVIDNFERALGNCTEEAASFAAGVEMIFRQMNAVFSKLGVEPIPALDCQFDPAWHEAVMRVEDSGKPEGTVVCEIQKGYKINDRVIRASMVKVAG